MALPTFYRAYAVDWKPTEGRVLSFTLRPHSNSNNQHINEVKATYEYAVDGKTYVSSQVEQDRSCYLRMEKILARFGSQNPATVRVRYNAAAPQDSHLVPISLIEQGALILSCLGVAAFFVWLLLRPMHPPSQAVTTGTGP
ncbi:hypothetical protein STIAU_8351 [Stigmatella aurantiaca DW4/3-1]|nr:hypothetical protein STIAU_8351 [Stigmatella aurantiaca DW4/3-1]